MPRGDKDKYTDKQKRMERHIEQGYEASRLTALAILATVKAQLGGLGKVRRVVKLLGDAGFTDVGATPSHGYYSVVRATGR